MDLDYVLDEIAKRNNLAPFGFDEDRAKKLLSCKEKELQQKINAACLEQKASQAELRYSNIPDKYRDMNFADLVMNSDNQQLIKHCSKYVKNYETRRKGIGFIGEMGVGKTTLMAIIGKSLVVDYEQSVYFATEEAMLDEIRHSYDDNSLDGPEDIIRRIGKHDVVMIDELGQTTTDWGIATLKRIIDTVIANNGKLFITTNYNSNELKQRWNDSAQNKTPRQVMDRLSEAMDFYKVHGKSFRREQLSE